MAVLVDGGPQFVVQRDARAGAYPAADEPGAAGWFCSTLASFALLAAACVKDGVKDRIVNRAARR